MVKDMKKTSERDFFIVCLTKVKQSCRKCGHTPAPPNEPFHEAFSLTGAGMISTGTAMIEPVAMANFFTVFFSAAMVIMTGALYALLFAYARMKAAPRVMGLAYLSYIGLAVSVLTLGQAANLFVDTFWTFIVGLMLLGYLLAPHGIWKLCVRTHAGEAHAAVHEPRDEGKPAAQIS